MQIITTYEFGAVKERVNLADLQKWFKQCGLNCKTPRRYSRDWFFQNLGQLLSIYVSPPLDQMKKYSLVFVVRCVLRAIGAVQPEK